MGKNNKQVFVVVIALVSGLIAGLILWYLGFSETALIIAKPIGKAFIDLLKMLAVPLIIAAIIKAITDVDLATLSALGKQTFILYLLTTASAVTIGLIIVNTIQPGTFISENTRQNLSTQFKHELPTMDNSQSLLEVLFGIIPENIFAAMSNNAQLLQVILFVFLFSIALLKVSPTFRQPIKSFFDGTNEVMMVIVDLCMRYVAPIGIFALMIVLVLSIPSYDLLIAISVYLLCVIGGLFSLMILYGLVLQFLNKANFFVFFKSMLPAQLLAFSTSSSAATLPITLICVTEKLKVKKEIAGFILPIGATVNMDGTSLYQAIAVVFIAQAFGIELSLTAQLGIVLTATLASIGAASVPSAGLIMLTIILEQARIPVEGMVLIIAIDRILDMFRTVTNVTGDAAVAVMMGNRYTN